MTQIRRAFTALTAGAAMMALAACSSNGSPSDSASSEGAAPSTPAETTIVVGFNSGPYEQMFTEGIQPILEAEGYTVERQSFSDGILVNQALHDGDIQANIMQHPVYMEYVNEQRGFDNVALVQVPGPPMGLYAGKSSASTPAEGASVALPNEPSNLYRALLLLQDAGWITVSDTIDAGTASLNDILDNPHDLDLQLLENTQAVRALADLDYAVVQGNFAVAGGLDLTSALHLEDLQDEFSVVVAVAGGTEDEQWAKDITAAYESDEFADYIAANDIYDGYHLPAYFGDDSQSGK